MSAADRLDKAMAKGQSRAWPELLIRFRAAEQALREIADVRAHPAGTAALGGDRRPDAVVAFERCQQIARRAIDRLERDVT